MTSEFDAPAYSEDPQERLQAALAMVADTENEQPLSRQQLAALSDLDASQIAAFRAVWQRLPSSRRIEVIKTLHTLAEDNVDLNFRPLCLECLDDPESTVRAIAVDGLWEDETLSTMRRLLGMLTDPSSEVRVAALLNLSRFAYRAAVDEISPAAATELERALLSVADAPQQAPDARRRATEGLGYFAASPEAQRVIEQSYATPEQIMRESALVAMGRSMRPEWYPTIERELRSPIAALRYAAALAIGEQGEDGQSMVPALLPLANDDDPEVVQAAIWALGQVGGSDAERIVRRMARSADPARQQAANAALAELTLDELE